MAKKAIKVTASTLLHALRCYLNTCVDKLIPSTWEAFRYCIYSGVCNNEGLLVKIMLFQMLFSDKIMMLEQTQNISCGMACTHDMSVVCFQRFLLRFSDIYFCLQWAVKILIFLTNITNTVQDLDPQVKCAACITMWLRTAHKYMYISVYKNKRLL